MQQKQTYSTAFTVMATLFTVCLIVSNLFASKVFAIGNITLPGAVVIFPISYILNDCFAEVWGFQIARIVIWTAFAMNLFVVLMSQLIVWLPEASCWVGAEHFNYMFNMAPRTAFASLLAFIVGSTVNAWVMAKMKIMQKGKGFSIRAIVSSIFGESLDSLIFMPIVFWGADIRSLLLMMLCQVSAKVLYEIISLPLTSLVVRRLKAHEESAG